MSHKYCKSSQVSPNGGVTSSIKDSEKSVVMCSLLSGAPRLSGWRVSAMCPSGRTRKDSFSTPLRPPRNTDGSPELTRPARRRSKFLSTTLRNRYSRSTLRQLGNNFDLHEESAIDQTLHLHPRGGRQSFLVVVLEAQIRGFQQCVHIRRIYRFLDHF